MSVMCRSLSGPTRACGCSAVSGTAISSAAGGTPAFRAMRFWIDLSNSPHPLLFAPVARRLGERGHSVVVTARDNAQTVELGRERWPQLAVIGGTSPKGR